MINATALIQTTQQLQSGTATFALIIAFIALLVGSVGIITTLYTSVNDRVSEIGTMKAIGAKNTFILALFMSEAFLIGILGATSGILIGIGGGYALSGMVPHSASGPGGGGGGGGGGTASPPPGPPRPPPPPAEGRGRPSGRIMFIITPASASAVSSKITL